MGLAGLAGERFGTHQPSFRRVRLSLQLRPSGAYHRMLQSPVRRYARTGAAVDMETEPALVQRSLETIEAANGIETQRLVYAEGDFGRIVRINQGTIGRVRVQAGSDHVIAIWLAEAADTKRWVHGKNLSMGARRHSFATLRADGFDDWNFDHIDVLQLHVPDTLVRETFAELSNREPDRLEMFHVMNQLDPSTPHFAHWVLKEAEAGPIPRLTVDTMIRLWATNLVMRCSNVSGQAPLAQAVAQQARPEDARVARVVDYIEAHIGEPLGVAELAGIACLSAGHFSRSFKATTGEAVWVYVQRRRGERAMEMLQTTALPIAQVAYTCGFANQGHFTQSFKRQFGVTPGAVPRNRQ